MARALVKDSRIVVLDEATGTPILAFPCVIHSVEDQTPRLASVDYVTERAIQATLRDSFATRTVLCVAHRLRTILAYDRVCVCDDGRVVELDTPLNLFAKTDGIFRGMCDRGGIDEKAIMDAQSDVKRGWIE